MWTWPVLVAESLFGGIYKYVRRRDDKYIYGTGSGVSYSSFPGAASADILC
jgi:hypothetical protein